MRYGCEACVRTYNGSLLVVKRQIALQRKLCRPASICEPRPGHAQWYVDFVGTNQSSMFQYSVTL